MPDLTKLSLSVRKKLGFYVYLYIDPRDHKPFYIGKGQGNRVFWHLRDTAEAKKTKVLKELSKLGLKPIVEILKDAY